MRWLNHVCHFICYLVMEKYNVMQKLILLIQFILYTNIIFLNEL